jgi:ribosomal protein S12 methylthiotransferase
MRILDTYWNLFTLSLCLPSHLLNCRHMQVDSETAQRRRDELISLQQKIGTKAAQAMVGRIVEVLVDTHDNEQEGVLVGRTQGDAPDIDNVVLLTNSEDKNVPPLKVGQLRSVLISDSITFDLVGQPVQ